MDGPHCLPQILRLSLWLKVILFLHRLSDSPCNPYSNHHLCLESGPVIGPLHQPPPLKRFTDRFPFWNTVTAKCIVPRVSSSVYIADEMHVGGVTELGEEVVVVPEAVPMSGCT